MLQNMTTMPICISQESASAVYFYPLIFLRCTSDYCQ